MISTTQNAVADMENEARQVLHQISLTRKPDPLPTGEWVYFIQAGADGPIKIGASKNPSRRFAQLQTASATELIPLGVVPGGKLAERNLHEVIVEDGVAERLAGEWFTPTSWLLSVILGITRPWNPR